MRSILIETDKRSVRELEFRGTLEHAYELLDCHLIEAVYIGDHILFVDEEGLITPKTAQKGFFIWAGYAQPLAGRGLIVGDGGEDWTDATMKTGRCLLNVTWLA